MVKNPKNYPAKYDMVSFERLQLRFLLRLQALQHFYLPGEVVNNRTNPTNVSIKHASLLMSENKGFRYDKSE